MNQSPASPKRCVEEAATMVEAWAEIDGVECEVDDLSFRHHAGDILEPELAEEFDPQ